MVTVLSVEPFRKRYRIRLDNGETLQLTAGLYRQRPLEPGQELDLEEMDQWLLLRQYPRALEQALRLLTARSHSQQELRDRLLLSGYRPCTVEMVLYKLSTLCLTDDAAFAREWVASRSRRYGSHRVMQELRQKGGSQEEAEAALAEIDPDLQAENARKAARRLIRRSKPGETPQQTRSRVMAALVRRGYSWTEARQALDTALDEGENT